MSRPAETSRPEVWFAHGRESGPWGRKISVLAEIARDRGHVVHSPDYRGMDSPGERLDHLIGLSPPTAGQLILVGSSMGGWVAGMAARSLAPAGLFLMAPAFHLPGYGGEPGYGSVRTSVVHGWHDELIPPEHSLGYCRAGAAELHLLASDHGLASGLPVIAPVFAAFLDAVVAAREGV